MGMNTMPTTIKAVITHPGVKIGLQAGSSCCVNFEYLGLLEFFLAAEDESDAPSLAPPELVAPLGVISTNTQTERKRRNGRVGEENYRKCGDFSLQKDKCRGDFLFKKCEKEKELAFR